MPEDKNVDEVDKFLSDLKSIEDRKQSLIDELLQQREAALKAFDEKLAKLGWRTTGSAKIKRSHHKTEAKQSLPHAVEAAAKGKSKPS